MAADFTQTDYELGSVADFYLGWLRTPIMIVDLPLCNKTSWHTSLEFTQNFSPLIFPIDLLSLSTQKNRRSKNLDLKLNIIVRIRDQTP